MRQSTARAISAPYSRARSGTPSMSRLVVLADVGGVGARDRALVAHPGDRHRGVEAAGEGDADAFAEWAVRSGPCSCGAPSLRWFGSVVSRRSLRSLLNHRRSCSTRAVALVGAAAGGRHGSWCAVGQVEEALLHAAPPAGSREITSTVSSPAIVPSTSPSSALSRAEARKFAAPGGRAEHDQVGAADRRRRAAPRTAGPGGSRSRRSRAGRRATGHRPRRVRRTPVRRWTSAP